MQIILRSKKEIENATKLEDILNEFYPELTIKIKVKPIKRKVVKKVVVTQKAKENKTKLVKKEQIKDNKNKTKIIKKDIIKPKKEKKIKKIKRKVYSIYVIDCVEDRIYKEDKFEYEMTRVIDKFKTIKSYQI